MSAKQARARRVQKFWLRMEESAYREDFSRHVRASLLDLVRKADAYFFAGYNQAIEFYRAISVSPYVSVGPYDLISHYLELPGTDWDALAEGR